MSTENACCPNCRSNDLVIVGCFLLGAEGVALSGGAVSPAQLLDNDFAITRELVRCETCKERTTLYDAQVAAHITVSEALWEHTQYAMKRPVVCPECGNAEHFVRTQLRLVEAEDIGGTEQSDGAAAFVVSARDSDPTVMDSVTTRYQCAQEGCSGVITLDKRSYELTAV